MKKRQHRTDHRETWRERAPNRKRAPHPTIRPPNQPADSAIGPMAQQATSHRRTGRQTDEPTGQAAAGTERMQGDGLTAEIGRGFTMANTCTRNRHTRVRGQRCIQGRRQGRRHRPNSGNVEIIEHFLRASPSLVNSVSRGPGGAGAMGSPAAVSRRPGPSGRSSRPTRESPARRRRSRDGACGGPNSAGRGGRSPATRSTGPGAPATPPPTAAPPRRVLQPRRRALRRLEVGAMGSPVVAPSRHAFAASASRRAAGGRCARSSDRCTGRRPNTANRTRCKGAASPQSRGKTAKDSLVNSRGKCHG